MKRRLIVAATGLAALSFGASARAGAANDGAALLARFAETLTAHDIKAFAELFAEDYVNHQVSAAAPPPPTGLSQKAASVAFFDARLKGIPDLRVEVEASVVSRDKAAASFVYTGTHGGPLFGVPPTGRTLRFTSCDIFAIRQGLFVEHWGMGDIAGVLAQLRG
jgi:steroid delta-isomerase-like uncharacterized protein